MLGVVYGAAKHTREATYERLANTHGEATWHTRALHVFISYVSHFYIFILNKTLLLMYFHI